jgi:acetyltransferase
MNEILEYYGNDEGTRVILLQVETFSDPEGFLRIASEITRRKPILALKAGRTAEGAVAVSSHTGKLLNQDQMADAMFARAGIMRFTQQECMCNAAIAFAQQPVPAGERVALVTNTGGPAILALDEMVEKGLELAKLEESTKKHLRENLYPMASVKNPVDVVATATPEHYGLTVDTLFKDPNVDSVLVNFISAPFVDLMGTADRLKEVCATSKKPVVCCLMTIEKWYPLMEAIRMGGTPVYEFPEHAARVLVAMTEYGKIKARGEDTCPRFEVDRAGAAAVLEPHMGSGAYIPQADAFRALACYGLPCPKVAEAGSKDELLAAAKDVGYPCVLKVDSASVVHKSDAGGVSLGLADETELVAALVSMQASFAEPGTRFVLMEQMPAGQEVIMGAVAQPGLDALVSFGLGGIFVEALKDVIFRLAPLSEREADEMITGIRGYPLLEGVRGRPGADLDVLRECLIRLSWLVKDFPFIEEMDLNPVFAYPKGEGAAVVDARMKVSGS